jgi:hypothetical protein
MSPLTILNLRCQINTANIEKAAQLTGKQNTGQLAKKNQKT